MRELKFRAWLKEEKKMVDVNQIDFADKTIMFDPIEVEDWMMGIAIFDEIKLMQYTGLKDINNEEIFVGDILKDKYGYKYIVKFEEGQFKIEGECFTSLRVVQIAVEKFNLEIIGNIYENPELLEDKE